ncbi:MAG TPA: hypothetical protein VEK34_07570 [Methylocella sp.]|nr:hypothetical protein [Methylocella sp.]
MCRIKLNLLAAVGVLGSLTLATGDAFAQEGPKLPIAPALQTATPPRPAIPSIIQKYTVAPANAADTPWSPAEASGTAPRLNFRKQDGSFLHMLPTLQGRAALKAAQNATTQNATTPNKLQSTDDPDDPDDPASGSGSGSGGPVLYHGGPIMPIVTVYPIWWAPATLQTGAAAGFSPLYSTLTLYLGAWFSQGHEASGLLTQYYQTINGVTSFYQNVGWLGGYYVDTRPLPASGCSDPATPGNCITDAQMEVEIWNVMHLNGWTPGFNKVFILYTPNGEGTCYSPGICSGSGQQYCGYHSAFGPDGSPYIYAIIPFADPAGCLAGDVSPNGDPYADSAVQTSSHEISESATDPLGTAWWDQYGNEVADLCNDEVNDTWANNTASDMMNGWVFQIQALWSNHFGGCVQLTP